MKNEIKLQIIEATQAYMMNKNVTAKDVAKLSGVNESYVSNMLRGIFTQKAGKGKDVAIADKYFRKLAELVDFKIKKQYWDTVITKEFEELIAAMDDAKRYSKCKVLIGETGCGKTYALDKFVRTNPANTYRITVSALYNLTDIINELLYRLKLDERGTKVSRLRRIAFKLRDIKQTGGQPIIFIDEAENLKVPALQMIKSLYDALGDHCPIVLIGTPELIYKMKKMLRKKKDGIPQFWRRFKAGLQELPEVDKSFTLFLNSKVQDKGLRKLLCLLCDNYGELHDYLEPALREADRLGQELNETFFRTIFNIKEGL